MWLHSSTIPLNPVLCLSNRQYMTIQTYKFTYLTIYTFSFQYLFWIPNRTNSCINMHNINLRRCAHEYILSLSKVERSFLQNVWTFLVQNCADKRPYVHSLTRYKRHHLWTKFEKCCHFLFSCSPWKWLTMT